MCLAPILCAALLGRAIAEEEKTKDTGKGVDNTSKKDRLESKGEHMSLWNLVIKMGEWKLRNK